MIWKLDSDNAYLHKYILTYTYIRTRYEFQATIISLPLALSFVIIQHIPDVCTIKYFESKTNNR